MNVLVITLQAVAALLGIGVIGFLIIGRKKVPSAVLGFLSSLSIDIAIPCLTLSSLIIDFSPEATRGWWRMPLLWIGFTIIALILSIVLSFLVKKEYRGEFSISLCFQNGLFFPLIIIVGLFGTQNQYLPLLFLFGLLQPTLMFSTYPLFFGRKSQMEKLNWQRVFNPVLVATIIGLFIALIGIRAYVPEFVKSILVMVGSMASPLFMLILGGTLYYDFMAEKTGSRKIFIGEIIKFVLLKNLVFPLVFLGLLILLRLDFSMSLIVFLQAAVPPVTAIPIFAERSGGNRSLASQLVVASFLFSVLTIPATLFLFNRFFPFPA
jgi:predicted permease